jgi:hypothetical protein
VRFSSAREQEVCLSNIPIPLEGNADQTGDGVLRLLREFVGVWERPRTVSKAEAIVVIAHRAPVDFDYVAKLNPPEIDLGNHDQIGAQLSRRQRRGIQALPVIFCATTATTVRSYCAM